MSTITLFPCPTAGCMAFPFETAEDLEGHLEAEAHVFSWGTGRQVATEAPRPFRSGGQGRRQASSAPAGPAPSDAQMRFIRSLVDRKGAPMPEPKTVREASAYIDILKGMADAAPASAPAEAQPEPPEGEHILDGRILTVKRSRKSGQLYATEGGEYLGKAGLKGLSTATVLTLEAAKAYGRRTGTCCCCGRKLTNPASVAMGIGPICQERFS